MGLLSPVAVKVGSWSFMPRYLPQIVATDTWLQKVTRGRLTILDIATLPNGMLTVTGRKSGLPRQTPLLAVPRAGGRSFLIAGSNFGGEKQPVWVVNLEANPDAQFRFKGRTHPVTARRLEGEDRAAAWAEMLRVWPNYALYEQRTDRHIKVFELTRTD